jgi:ABC-type lipoprotein release transport system permease subunit
VRAVRQEREVPAVPAAGGTGLPVTAVAGIRHALEHRSGRLRAPVRATLTGAVVAVTALVAALVFGASLTGLVTHPSRYGWNWTVLIQDDGGFDSWAPAIIGKLVSHQPGVTGWSEFGFGQLAVRGAEVPVMGVLRHAGMRAVEPPTISGHPLTGPGHIELGTETMRQLGLRIGDRVRVGTGSHQRELTVAGTVTLPSFGADGVSLGRGAVMEEETLLAVQGFLPEPANGATTASTSYPSAAAIHVSSRTDARALAARITAANPAGTPGGTYQLGPQLGAQVINASQMGSQPLALAIGVAAAAVLALGLSVLTSVRRRRRDLALLKALGLRPRQVRAVIAWQTNTILVIAAIAGVPLGIAGGRWAWTSFATAIGVVPSTVIPSASLAAGVAALFVAGNLLASGPALIAARIAPAAAFRAE